MLSLLSSGGGEDAVAGMGVYSDDERMGASTDSHGGGVSFDDDARILVGSDGRKVNGCGR
jgi:hypothetical protein